MQEYGWISLTMIKENAYQNYILEVVIPEYQCFDSQHTHRGSLPFLTPVWEDPMPFSGFHK